MFQCITATSNFTKRVRGPPYKDTSKNTVNIDPTALSLLLSAFGRISTPPPCGWPLVTYWSNIGWKRLGWYRICSPQQGGVCNFTTLHKNTRIRSLWLYRDDILATVSGDLLTQCRRVPDQCSKCGNDYVVNLGTSERRRHIGRVAMTAFYSAHGTYTNDDDHHYQYHQLFGIFKCRSNKKLSWCWQTCTTRIEVSQGH